MKRINSKLLLNMGVSALLMIYPLWVYFGLQYLEPRYVGLLIFLALLMRFLTARRRPEWKTVKSLGSLVFAGGALSIAIMLSNELMLVRLNPVLINLTMLTVFISTLIKPPSMIERLARLTEPDLPEKAVSYTRNVTIAWCAFFAFNAAAAAVTTFYASLEVWTLYNGLIAYLLMGLVFAVEYVIRHIKMNS